MALRRRRGIYKLNLREDKAAQEKKAVVNIAPNASAVNRLDRADVLGRARPFRGGDNSNYEIVRFSDMGEANSRKVIDICREYGVVKQRTGGYTPEHNAFAERWFRTNAEMSTCQMLQFDRPENMWEDSRKMATFIYNRVPLTRQTPGEE